MKKTPFYDTHVELGGKIVEFGEWLLPVQYSGIIDEHNAVRTKAGLFDVSHMGEVRVKGGEAEKFVNTLVTNDVSKLAETQILYTPMCLESGGIVDDLLVYKFSHDEFLLVINAANIAKDWEWIKKNAASFKVTVANESDRTAQIAIQGPLAEKILCTLVDIDLSLIQYYWFKIALVDGVQAMVSRTGYTGEDGFEIYFEAGHPRMFKRLIEAGAAHGLRPCGLGARDTLRFESKLVLYGNDIDETTTPIEAGLKWTVKLEKGDFNGKSVIAKQCETGTSRKLVGLEMLERGIPRSHYEVFALGKNIGMVTSGTQSPTLKKALALAYVKTEFSKIGTEIDVKIREKFVKAKIVKTPFYKRDGK